MTIAKTRFEFGDVVWVPFPFVETPRLRPRPALVVAAFQPTEGIDLLWVLMITSAVNRGWASDISLERRFGECGLEVPCILRLAKIATVEAANARKRGRLPDDLRDEVRTAMTRALA